MTEKTNNNIPSRSFDVVAAYFGLTCMTVPVFRLAGKPQTQNENCGTGENSGPELNTKLKLGLTE